MGVVVLATHLQLGEPVALKFLRPEAIGSERAVARFVREARATVRIKSRHVVRVLDVGATAAGAPFIVMEHLTGRDLAAVLRERGPLPVEQAVDWVRQACSGMREAHALGIVHRDLKPSNLFLAEDESGATRVKILDFGIAKVQVDLDAKLTSTGAAMGSPQYMSPEQLRDPGDVDARTDVWSLGVILHELVTGRSPFEAERAHALCAKIAADAPATLREHLPGAPVELEALVRACLEKDPSRRTASVAELECALDAFSGRAPETLPTAATVDAPVTMGSGPGPVDRRRSRALSVAVGLLAVGLALAASTRLYRAPAPLAKGADVPSRPALPTSASAALGTPVTVDAPDPTPPAAPRTEPAPPAAPERPQHAAARPRPAPATRRREADPSAPPAIATGTARVEAPPPPEPAVSARPAPVDPMGDRL